MFDSADHPTQQLGLRGILGRTFGRQEDHFGDSVDAPKARSGQAEGPREAALGRDAKYVRQTSSNALFREERRRLFAMQRSAAMLLPKERVSNCRWAVQSKNGDVEVHVDRENRASYSGLQTCSSVWHCPVCARRISEQRRLELNHLLAWSREQALVPVMLTLTFSHGRHDDLADILRRMKSALRRFRRRRDWNDMKLSGSLIGTVSATEVTYGEQNGFHPHLHIIMIMHADDEAQAVERVEELGNGWLVSLRAEGLDGTLERAFSVQGAEAAGTYMAKWGAAEELALQGKKKGRAGSRTPTELLSDYTMKGDKRAGALWSEYAKAFKGMRQLVWSDDLKVIVGIPEMNDAEAEALQDTEFELVGTINYGQWIGDPWSKGVKYRRVRVLEATEQEGRDGFAREVAGRGVSKVDIHPSDDDFDLIEDPPDPRSG